MNAPLDLPQPDLAALRADQSLGQIAVQLPGATAIFRRLKLDFCCGGQISLRQAAQNKQLDLGQLLQELAALERDDTPPTATEPTAMIDHILARYHEVHRAQLPELIRMARRVEAVHRDHPQVPAGLADHLDGMHEELLSHMQKEESILFPMIKAGPPPFVTQPISVMRAEHTTHGEALEQLMTLTQDATPPQEACNTWRALYAGIAQFADDLVNHIHLENNLLFPQFEPAAEAGCGSACGCQ